MASSVLSEHGKRDLDVVVNLHLKESGGIGKDMLHGQEAVEVVQTLEWTESGDRLVETGLHTGKEERRRAETACRKDPRLAAVSEVAIRSVAVTVQPGYLLQSDGMALY
jgi:hypothetical protein